MLFTLDLTSVFFFKLIIKLSEETFLILSSLFWGVLILGCDWGLGLDEVWGLGLVCEGFTTNLVPHSTQNSSPKNENENTTQTVYSENENNEPTSDKLRCKKKTIIIIACVVLFLVIAIGVVIIVVNNAKSAPNNNGYVNGVVISE